MKTGKCVLHPFKRTQNTSLWDSILVNVPKRMLYIRYPFSLGSDGISYFAMKRQCALLCTC